jgi:HlyD family secretion protein
MADVAWYRRLFTRAFWTRWKIAIASVLVLAALGAAFYPHDPAIAYETATIARGNLEVKVSATGTLQPGNKVDVGTEVSGRVDQTLVDSNDRVKTGQLIAVINTDSVKAQMAQFQATLGQARATLATNQATVEQTLAKRNRYRTLLAQGGGAVALQDVQAADGDYDRAVASVALAKAQIESAQAQIENTQTQIDKATVRSPIDGVVLNRAISVGQTVQGSFSTPVLFTLASDLSVMQLSIDIDEADIGMVHEGQTATFTVDAFPNRHFDAKLVTLYNSPKTTNNVVTFPGSLLVDNRSLLLRPGLTATAEILVAHVKNALLVPNAALRFTPPPLGLDNKPPPPAAKAPDGKQGGRVWVLVKNKLEARDLILGRSDGVSTEVLSGKLAKGETVITDIKSQIVRPTNQ